MYTKPINLCILISYHDSVGRFSVNSLGFSAELRNTAEHVPSVCEVLALIYKIPLTVVILSPFPHMLCLLFLFNILMLCTAVTASITLTFSHQS